MKFVLVALAALFVGTAHAQRVYNQAELDAMLAPIALQPDGVVSQILIATTYPEEVAAAASWSRANPHLRGDDALRAVQNEPWDPAVKALVAFPELLARMEESPQWVRDLGEAFVLQEPHVMDTVQALRRRAQASGNLASTDDYAVYSQGEAIVVQPRTQVVYVRYYDPYVVYGPWWWPHYRPVYWRPWVARPVFVAHGFFYSRPDWHHRHVRVVHRPVHVHRHHSHVAPGRWQKPVVVKPQVVVKPHVRVPESQRRPIVSSAPIAREGLRKEMPAASGFTQHRSAPAARPETHRRGTESAQQHRSREERSEFRQDRGERQHHGGGQHRGHSQRGRDR
jgi:hypothetical protein